MNFMKIKKALISHVYTGLVTSMNRGSTTVKYSQSWIRWVWPTPAQSSWKLRPGKVQNPNPSGLTLLGHLRWRSWKKTGTINYYIVVSSKFHKQNCNDVDIICMNLLSFILIKRKQFNWITQLFYGNFEAHLKN